MIVMMTPMKPPVPEEERAFGFSAQVLCQGVVSNQRISFARKPLARDVRLADELARRRAMEVNCNFHTMWKLRRVDRKARRCG